MTYSLKRQLTTAMIKMDIALLFSNILVTVSELKLCQRNVCGFAFTTAFV